MTAIGRLAGLILRPILLVALVLVLAELLVSWLAPQTLLVIEPGLYQPDPPGRYRLTPGYRGSITNRVEFDHSVYIDQRGLRSSDGSTPSAASSAAEPISIMVIGDSFVFGIGVDNTETFTTRLGTHGDFGTANGGLPGTGVPDVVDWYERHGRELRPDVLLLGIFLGNDLADARPDREAIEIRHGLVVPAGTSMGLSGWLYRHLDLFRLLRNAAGSPTLAGLRQTLDLSEPWVIRNLRWEFSIYALTPPDQLVAAEAATDLALERLAGICSEDGTELIAALLPARVQLAPLAWQSALAMVGLDPAVHDPLHPSRTFQRLLGAHAIPYLDLGPAFTAALGDSDELYYRKDRHWTAAGHELAARQLAAFLSRQFDDAQ